LKLALAGVDLLSLQIHLQYMTAGF